MFVSEYKRFLLFLNAYTNSNTLLCPLKVATVWRVKYQCSQCCAIWLCSHPSEKPKCCLFIPFPQCFQVPPCVDTTSRHETNSAVKSAEMTDILAGMSKVTSLAQQPMKKQHSRQEPSESNGNAASAQDRVTVNIQEAATVKLSVRTPDTLSYLCEFGEARVITNKTNTIISSF